MSLPTDRSRRWRRFCQAALGTDRSAPLKGIPGATINALTSAFRECVPSIKGAAKSAELPDFGAEVFNSPWTVYVIRNEATMEVYIGTAQKGFANRYHSGEWWTSHHNKRLQRDAIMYGVRNFKIAIHVCDGATDMRRVEALLLRMHRPVTYNERPEQDTIQIGDDQD